MEIKLLLKLLLLLPPLLILQQAAASHSTDESLPGLHGPLPFHLETGYVGVGKDEEVQLFYYFLPSESNPTTDPLLIWLTGGPGCSSFVAIVNEIGPLRITDQAYNGSLPTFVLNPHAWTKIASVIFLDQPANTGFSYATTSAAYKYTDLQACRYAYEFLTKWLSDHSQFISNPFYVAGNSYSGNTVPIITQLISDGNAAGNEPMINLQGYLLGNPLTFPHEFNYRIPYCRGMGLISDELYKSLKKNCRGEYKDIDPNNRGCANDVQTFNQMVRNICTQQILLPNCDSDAELQGPDDLSGERRLLLDDKRISLNGVVQSCDFDWRRALEYWANDPEVQNVLRVRKGTIESWKECRRSIQLHNYTRTINNVVPYHANLSTRGYRSLIYSGDLDFVIPFQSTQVWIKSLNYSIADDWRPWNIDDQVAGYTRSYSNKMTYATVKGSGHTACTHKPKECFDMFKRWISHDHL